MYVVCVNEVWPKKANLCVYELGKTKGGILGLLAASGSSLDWHDGIGLSFDLANALDGLDRCKKLFLGCELCGLLEQARKVTQEAWQTSVICLTYPISKFFSLHSDNHFKIVATSAYYALHTLDSRHPLDGIPKQR